MLDDKTEEELRNALAELEEAEKNAPLWDNVENIIKSPAAKQAFARCAKTNPIMLDLWFEDAYWEARKEATEAAKQMVERILAKKAKPDAREAIVNGTDDFGQVFIPTALFRALWKLGDQADAMLEKRGSGDAVEATARDVLDLSVDWVRFCRGKGRRPEVEEMTVTPMEGQKLLQKMNSEPRPESESAPF